MRTDKNYHQKIEILREFFRGGGVYQSLDQMRGLLGYANRAGVKGFFTRLISNGLMQMKDR